MRLLNISLKFFGNYDFFSFNILLNKLQPLKLFSSKLLLKGMRWKKLRGNILAKTPDWAIFYRDFGRTVSKSPMPANRWRPHPAKIVFKSGWRNEFQSNYLTFRRFLFSGVKSYSFWRYLFSSWCRSLDENDAGFLGKRCWVSFEI